MRVLCRRTNKEYTKYCLAYSLFQSPSSVWRTTEVIEDCKPLLQISIPVLRVEDDLAWKPSGTQQTEFQSPSSVWRTTHGLHRQGRVGVISIPVLRVEDDASGCRLRPRPVYFNPRPPCGGRRRLDADFGLGLFISIPVLRVEDDMAVQIIYIASVEFQSPSSVWRTTRQL